LKFFTFLALFISLVSCANIERFINGTCGTEIDWTLDTTTGLLSINGSGGIANYYSIINRHAPWFEYRQYITSLSICNVSSIGNEAFMGLNLLTSVNISSSVHKIYDYAFSDCTSLTSFNISVFVDSIGVGVFANCTNLASINVDKSNSKYKSDHGLLLNKDGSRLISCPGAMRSVEIPDTVTSIERHAFDGCHKLNFNEYENSFYLGNENNKYHILIKVKDNSVSSYLINYNTKIITQNAFSNCLPLKSIVIPNSVAFIGSEAFSNCTELESVTLGSGITTIEENAFKDCSALESVTLSNNYATQIYKYRFPYTHIHEIIIGDYVTSIYETAFKECSAITNVTIGKSVAVINTQSFDGCTGLSSIEIPGSVKTINYQAFYGCSKLKSVSYYGISNPYVAPSMEQFSPFYGCKDLKTVYVPLNYEQDDFCGKPVTKLLEPVKNETISSSTSSSGSKLSIYAIVGIVVGSIAFVAIVTIVIVLLIKHGQS